jgi:hypothetical protein
MCTGSPVRSAVRIVVATHRFDTDICGQDKEADGDHLLRPPLGTVRFGSPAREPLKQGESPRLPIKLSTPNPTSAIDDAATPAPTAMANSTKCQPIPAHASSFARRTHLARSSEGRVRIVNGID